MTCAGWAAEKVPSSAEQRQLYDERIYPLMRVWFFEQERFEEEYVRLRARWAGGTPDDRQFDLFAV